MKEEVDEFGWSMSLRSKKPKEDMKGRDQRRALIANKTAEVLSFTISMEEIMNHLDMKEYVILPWPMVSDRNKKDATKVCSFHKDIEHRIEKCKI